MSRVAQPISFLSPFVGRNWTIKARVTDKSDVRTWDKPNSKGSLMSFTLVDESAAIRCTLFNDAIARFNHILAPNSIVYVSGGSIKNANKRFNSVANDYELTLDDNSQIEICNDVSASNSIPLQRYNFLAINCLPKREADSLVDILGVVVGINDVGKIVQKSTGKELVRRTVRVADQTASVDMTIWGDQAYTFNYNIGDIIAVRAARVGTFDGCSLALGNTSSIDLNPRVNGVDAVANWYKNTGGSDAVCISGRKDGAFGEGGDGASNNRGRKYLDQVPGEGLGKSEKGDYIDLRCTPFYMRAESLTYLACPTCNKKVATGPDGSSFHCDKCVKPIINPSNRYMCSVHVSDNVTTAWITLFNEAGEQFFGVTADELMRLGSQDPNYIVSAIASRLFQPVIMRVRVKEESFGTDSEQRMRYTASRISSIAGAAEGFPSGTWAKEAELLSSELALY